MPRFHTATSIFNQYITERGSVSGLRNGPTLFGFNNQNNSLTTTMQEYKLTPQEEDAYVEQQFRDLLDGYLASNHRKKVEIIERAFRFAKEAHKGVRRRSGEPYIIHPIAVAKIASQEIGLSLIHI